MGPTSHRRSRSAFDDAQNERNGDASRKRVKVRKSELEEEDVEEEFHSFAPEKVEEELSENGLPAASQPPSGPPGRQAATFQAGFQPGAILRVTVENFVTYEHAEFLPGPNLNMVIGPNGTGKSSLVCAICLGLGYPANVLGRATKLNEFVKHGKDEATIEIELQKRPKDARNPVIKLRLLSTEEQKRQFWLNGEQVPQREIHRLMGKFRIQIDNLCQFLPQDKVSEFSGVNPVDLLSRTLQATAPPKIIEQQVQLRELYKRQKDFKQNSEQDADTLRIMLTKQQGMQADMERLREREEIEKTIHDWERALKHCLYQEARRDYKESKNKKTEAERKLRRFQAGAGPAMEAVNAKQEYARQIKECIPHLKRQVAQDAQLAEQMAKNIEAMDDKLRETEGKRNAQSDGLGNKKRELAVIRKTITDLENRLKNQEPDFDAASWNTRIREKEHRSREIESERRQIQEELVNTVVPKGKQTSREKSNLQGQIRSLDTREGQELSRIEHQFPDVAAGYKWLLEHQSDFKKEVFGPAALSCAIKDETYSDLVQSGLQQDDFLCFVAQCKEDHTKLSDIFFKEMNLSVNIRTCTTPLQSFRPPLSNENLTRLGLDGFAIDFIDGPGPVLAMLCADKQLHKFAVGKRGVSDQQYERLIQPDGVGSFAAGEHYYKTTRRAEYGPQAVSTMTNAIRPGRFWTDQPVDAEEKNRLKQKLNEVMEELTALSDRKRELDTRTQALDSKHDEISQELRELRAAKSEQQREYNQWRSLPDKIASEKAKLEHKIEELREVQSTMRQLASDMDSQALEIAKEALRHKEQLPRIEQANLAYIDAQIKLAEAESDVAALKTKNQQVHDLLEEGKRVIARLGQEVETLKERGLALGAEVRESMQETTEEDLAHINEMLGEKPSEEVRNELQAQKSRLEYVHAADPGIIRQFEMRAKEIEKLQQTMARRQGQADELSGEIDQIRAEWEPQVDELVGRINDAFSYNFEQISCAGEISIHKDEDFSQWAINIKVKFRENEELQQLDQHRQSGGERSVSTIFYLMSLQSMAQAPFRVVDEINQGMDPRNERMVHERMVDIACDEHSSQYFLITPKLLTGLRYHPRMKVLCIASGPYVPADNRKMDFREFARIQRRLIAAA
ncbi:hypothetical protein MCOR07_009791 [Pyricularia oryzae]|nr:hypothetical protein MCOR19_010999 [Pyricularia oryzae]KAI6264450.1 hypothetical protein MCOR26_011337 [Pyricularia oryzae]KAI6311083.1 hypothetical protein MCOR29_008373 [Pyricularia oryzae]KAI6392734.1 hypothetical protein MCOR20_011037 [Pyricularia oryzae]KAI6403405.1 hypothetical protein MCOR23_003531 [Pyricularia oryzae]